MKIEEELVVIVVVVDDDELERMVTGNIDKGNAGCSNCWDGDEVFDDGDDSWYNDTDDDNGSGVAG